MKPEDFKRWRKSLALSQKEAAEALGLKRRVVQYYEKGERNGDKVIIPKAVRLACFALAQGVTEYRGPTRQEAHERRATAKEEQKREKAAGKSDSARKKKKDMAGRAQ